MIHAAKDYEGKYDGDREQGECIIHFEEIYNRVILYPGQEKTKDNENNKSLLIRWHSLEHEEVEEEQQQQPRPILRETTAVRTWGRTSMTERQRDRQKGPTRRRRGLEEAFIDVQPGRRVQMREGAGGGCCADTHLGRKAVEIQKSNI